MNELYKPLTQAEKKDVKSFFSTASEKQSLLLTAMQVKPEVFQNVMLNVALRYPAVARCSKQSLYEAVCRACEAGIVPDGKLAAIVPINMKGVPTAQFWWMVDGLLLRVRENIPGISIQSHNVHEGDEFLDQRGSKPNLVHIVEPTASRTVDTLIASYAVAYMPNNDIPEVAVMYKSEMDYNKPNRKAGPWITHPLEMYRGRPIKLLCKRLPLSASFSIHVEDDADIEMHGENVVYDGEASYVDDVMSQEAPAVAAPKQKAPPKTRAKKTATKPKAQAKAPEPEPFEEPEQDPEDLGSVEVEEQQPPEEDWF